MATGPPRIQRWKNGGVSTLAAAITSAGQTTIQITDPSAFPATPDFTLVIGDVEIVDVIGISGSTFTVDRGQENTTPVLHGNGTVIALYNTGGGQDRAFQDAMGLPDYPFNRVLEGGVTRTEADFTWINKGTADSFTADDGGIRMTSPSEASNQVRLKQRAAPVTPYKVTVFAMLGPGFQDFNGSDGTWMGPCFRDGTGKLYVLALRGDRIALFKLDSPTTFNSQVDSQINNNRHAMWLQLEDDGTDVKANVSVDGYVWEEIASEGRTTFMASGPTQIGFAINSGGSDANAQYYFKTWIQD